MRKMKFVVDKCSEAVSRLGQLELPRPSGGTNLYETPTFFVHTQAGSVPHITSEVFDIIFGDSECRPPLQMSIDNLYVCRENLGPSKLSISKFCGFPDTPCLLTLLSPSETFSSGFNDKNGVSVKTRMGRRSVNLKTFASIIQDFQPTLFQCLHDYDVNSNTMEKRLKKSTTRAVDYLQETLANLKDNKAGMLVPIEPAWFHVNEMEGKKTFSQLLESQAEYEGFIFRRNCNEEKDFVELFSLVSKEIPKDKLVAVSGAFIFSEIVELVLKGADVFDTSICTQLTEDKQVLILPLFPSEQGGTPNESLPDRKDSASTDSESQSYLQVMDMKEKKYLDDFQPLSADCKCYTCRKHTRSYIHHLHVTNELLGRVLIMAHNLVTFDRFFRILRSCLKSEDSSQIQMLKKMVAVVDTGAVTINSENDNISKAIVA